MISVILNSKYCVIKSNYNQGDVILNITFYSGKDFSTPVIDIVEKLGASPCPCPLLFCASGLNNIGG
jgi:repressor of nif and glnA expression